MKKVKNIQNENLTIDLTDLQQTNHLFLDLLYDLSKYPHTQTSKKLVRAALFSFEEEVILRTTKDKNDRY